MAEENDQFWKDVKGKVRRAFDLNPLCREEAEELAKRARKDKKMSDEDVDSIMEFVLSWGQKGGLSTTPPPSAPEEDGDDTPAWTDDPMTREMMDEEIAVLNSNAGEKDPETEDLIEKLRREALDDAETDDNQDSSGMGDGEEPSGSGH
jgi:hypothetical protein